MSDAKIQVQEYRPTGSLPDDILEYIEQCRLAENSESHLISILHNIQDRFGYLSKENMDAVSYLMQIPAAKVTGVASFYHYFSFVPRGQHRISLCLGTACYVKGAARNLARLEELLGIGVGETTADGQFSIEAARCVGACALAPVLIVGDDVYGAVGVEDLPKILSQYGYTGAGRPE